MLNTRTVTDRRTLRFKTLDDVLADVEAIDRAGASSIRTTGNWTAAQIVEHVAKLIILSIDGFPARAPWYMRFGARLMKSRILRKPLPPGLRLPARFDFLEPDAQVTWPQAIKEIREAVGRARDGRMLRPSPVLGRLTHKQWVQLHCRHAEMHFSFMHPPYR